MEQQLLISVLLARNLACSLDSMLVVLHRHFDCTQTSELPELRMAREVHAAHRVIIPLVCQRRWHELHTLASSNVAALMSHLGSEHVALLCSMGL